MGLRRYFAAMWTYKILENNGSAARDHLANERTYLAWLRTGFTIAALGLVLARLQPNTSEFTKVLAKLLVLLGLLFVILGLIRYAQVSVLLDDEKFPASGLLMTIVSILTIASFVAAFVLLLLKD